MPDRLLKIIKVIIKPDSVEGLLITIGAIFLGGGYIFGHSPSQIVGVLMILVGIVLRANQ